MRKNVITITINNYKQSKTNKMKTNEKKEQQGQGTATAQKQNQGNTEKGRQQGTHDSLKKSPTASGDRKEGDANAKLSADRSEKKQAGQLEGFKYQRKDAKAEKGTAVAEEKNRGGKKTEQDNEDDDQDLARKEPKLIRGV